MCGLFSIYLLKLYFDVSEGDITVSNSVPAVVGVPQFDKLWCRFTSFFQVFNQKWQQWLRERATVLGYILAYIAYLVYTNRKQVLRK